MKRILLFCALFLLGMACSQEEVVPPKDSNAEEIAQKVDEYQTPGDHMVTAAEALSRAETIFSRWKTRSTPRVVKSCEYFVARPATRSLADTIEVAFHLINYEDNAGFAMVAADERATDIYAYSDEGQLTAADFEQNPGLSIYKEIATEAYINEVTNPSNVGPVVLTPGPGNGPYGDIPRLIIVKGTDGNYYHARYEEITSSVPYFIETTWHQNYPYNAFCEGNVTGCGPLAAAQIMTYHGHPATFDGYIYHWENMRKNFNSVHYDVASLIRQIGVEADADYGVTATSTTKEKIYKMFREFGYDCTRPQYYDQQKFIQHLDARMPIWVRGKSSSGGAHAWVVDGFRYSITKVTYYYTYIPYDRANVSYQNGTFMAHCNWGWGGLDDGYYYLPSGIEYNDNIRAIYGIAPIH